MFCEEMVMKGYIISERAKNDLREIGYYTKKVWSRDQAELYLRALLNVCSNLVNNPYMGRSYDEFRAGLRGFRCGKHIVFYRILSKKKIRIVRFLHERMDIFSRL